LLLYINGEKKKKKDQLIVHQYASIVTFAVMVNIIELYRELNALPFFSEEETQAALAEVLKEVDSHQKKIVSQEEGNEEAAEQWLQTHIRQQVRWLSAAFHSLTCSSIVRLQFSSVQKQINS
jgi:DNA-binding GntR family transcriptional regulator